MAKYRPAPRSRAASRGGRWLLLVQQLPTEPSNARVKTWRRLQQIGAVPIKNSVYVLPRSPQAREDFEWIKTEIVALGGQATVFAADALESAEEQEIVEAFRAARGREYAALREALEQLQRKAPHGRRSAEGGRYRRAARACREELERLRAIDFFAAPGRDEAASALETLERQLAAPDRDRPREAGSLNAAAYRRRTWVTRPRPGIDRIGSAWLIRRFIDPDARFAFAARPPAGRSARVPFDYFGVDFGHHGDCCTFEVLANRFGIRDEAVERVGELVHDLDLKDDRYGAAEAPAFGRLVEGLQKTHATDRALLEQGIAMIEALYRSLSAEPNQPVSGRRRR